jgi:phosphate transport system permease protein
MTAATPEVGALTVDRSTVRRKLVDKVATVLISASFLAAAIPLAFLFFYVARAGGKVLTWNFVTKDIPFISSQYGPGMGPAVVGTLLITATATAIAAPLGILGAIYLSEYGKTSRLASLIRLMSDVMTGVPSIVMGLFVYTIWVLRYGLSGLAGAIALACLMLPVIVRTSEEMLRLVPANLREASAALGVRTWKTTLRVVVPAALPGIVSGVLLAVARAAGETAPLLFTIGVVSSPNTSLFGTNTALSAQIFKNAQSPFLSAQERAWGAALTLILLVFVLTVAARITTARFAKR